MGMRCCLSSSCDLTRLGVFLLSVGRGQLKTNWVVVFPFFFFFYCLVLECTFVVVKQKELKRGECGRGEEFGCFVLWMSWCL